MEMYSTDLFRHTSGYATQFGPAREHAYYRSDSSENLQGLYNRPQQAVAAPAPAPVQAQPWIWSDARLDPVFAPLFYVAGDPRCAGVASSRVEDGQGGNQQVRLTVPQPQPLPPAPAEAQESGSRRSLFARALRSLVCGSRRTP